tara:strand:- start:704 stop:835 length:132 start_codon:yes stop_codon:yes gene_type:complete
MLEIEQAMEKSIIYLQDNPDAALVVIILGMILFSVVVVSLGTE